ncbi:MAG: hypothetical protein IKF47_00220 [Bacilli bacterium]|nr:hypothetical protein [Bacilli bacterium]
MLKIERYGEWDKIKTLKELKVQLKSSERVLSKPTIDYLNSLLNLEFSVVKNNIDKNERELLSGMEIYQSIGKFNIYHHALKLFKNNNNLKINDNSNGIEGICVSIKDGNTRGLFNYNYSQDNDKNILPCGKIEIVRYVDGATKKEKEIKRLKGELEKMELPSSNIPFILGGAATDILNNYYGMKKTVEKLQDELAEGLSSKDQNDIALSKKYYELLLKDYGLKKNDFTPFDIFNEDPLSDENYIEIPNTVTVYVKTYYI